MPTGRIASTALIAISAILLLTQIGVAQRPAAAICTVVDRNPIDQRRLLWTPGRPVLTVTYRVSNKRIYGNLKLFDQNSVLAHGEFQPRASLTQAASQSRLR